MKTCDGCQHAKWKLRKDGGLHPSKEGQCTYEVKLPQLPNSMQWPGFGPPKPLGRYIERGHVYDKPCPYYLPDWRKVPCV